MNDDSLVAIMINDLDSLVYRIEALPAHPRHTEALTSVIEARDALKAARSAIHQEAMRKRFAST